MTRGFWTFSKAAHSPSTGRAPVPLGDDPASQYIRASSKSAEQKANELAAAAKRGITGPGRMMGKTGDKR